MRRNVRFWPLADMDYWTTAPHTSAFGDKADVTFGGIPLLRALLG